MVTECENEKDEMMTEISNGDNLTIALSKKNTRDNAFEVNYLKIYFIIYLHKSYKFNVFIKTCFLGVPY